MKGKPFNIKQQTQSGTDRLGYPLKRPLASQISKIDWQSEKLSSDHWRFLNRILGQFAEILPSSLTPVMQLRAIVEPEEIAPRSFGEFLEQFSDPTPYTIFNLNDKGKGIWVVDRTLSFSMMDYLMGGRGEPVDDPREFTDLEKILFQKQILSRFFAAFSEAWAGAASLNLQFEQMEFSSNRLLVFSFSESLITARFALRLGASSGTFHLAIPFRQVREIIPKNPDEYITQSRFKKTEETPPVVAAHVGKKIEAAPILITVELGMAEVPFQDLLNLEAGDILRLDAARTEPVKVKVSGKNKFLAKPGASENKVAVQITQVLQEGDELYDE